MRNRQILHVVTSDQRRGAEASAVALSAELANRGYRTRVVALAPTATPPRLPVSVLGSRPLGLSTLRRLRHAAKSADVVIAHGSRTLPAVAMAAMGLRRSLIYQNIGDPLFWAGSPLRHWRVERLLRRMGAVAALTEQSAAVLEEAFGVPSGRIALIRNMRDGSSFRPPTNTETAAARRSLGLPLDARVVAVVGALSPEKRVDIAISTVALMDDVILVVVGTGDQRGALEEQATREAPGRVRFLGGVTDVVTVLHASDAVLLTSDSEGVPGVLIEAGLCARPVISRAVGYVADVVDDGMTGMLVDSPDPVTLGRALGEALASGDRLGTAARERCMSRFDTESIVDEWVNLLTQVRPRHRVGQGRRSERQRQRPRPRSGARRNAVTAREHS